MSAHNLPRPATAPIRLQAVIEWDEDPADWGTLLPRQIAWNIASDEDYLSSLLDDEEIVVEISVDPATEANRDAAAIQRVRAALDGHHHLGGAVCHCPGYVISDAIRAALDGEAGE